MKMKNIVSAGVAVLLAASPAFGWDFTKSNIPTDEITGGGPPRDGIPALFNPKYMKAGDAVFMRDDEQVIGLEIGGEARAYPLRILSWHELVNDTVGGTPLLVSW